jgi:hypothetical protein
MPIDPRAVEKEIEGGLTNERRARLDVAKMNADYWEGNFDPYLLALTIDPDCLRSSLVMQRVVRVLTANLYAEGPARELPDHPDASEWLEAVYRANAMDAKWQAADRLATVNDFAAFEVSGTLGPRSAARPVTITLWGGDQLAVWVDPDDPTEPAAVATLDKFDNQRRARLWTLDERVTFLTEKWAGGAGWGTSGATAYRLVAREANPYGRLPFAFVHFEFPATDFFVGGPGTQLRKLNEHINYRLSDSAEQVVKNRPIGTLSGAPADWNFPRDRRPGTFVTIPGVQTAGEALTEGRADYVHCDLGFVRQDWDDLQAYLDHTLEMVGVPPSAIRLVQDSARSGIAIVAEQLPLILWAQGRQRPFGHYERELARLVLEVGARHLEANSRPRLAADESTVERPARPELAARAAELAAASIDPGLVLSWPDLMPDLPGPERDQADQWLLDNKLISRVLLLMRREKLTRAEAELYLAQVAEDTDFEEHLFGPQDFSLDDEDEADKQGEKDLGGEEYDPDDDSASDSDDESVAEDPGDEAEGNDAR